jgi:hypothetical protein
MSICFHPDLTRDATRGITSEASVFVHWCPVNHSLSRTRLLLLFACLFPFCYCCRTEIEFGTNEETRARKEKKM